MKRTVRIFFTAAARNILAAFSYVRFAGKKNLLSQIDRHLEHWNLDNAIAISHVLVPRIVAAGLPRDARVLVVGCCNMLEIYTFFSYGYRKVQGIDLVSHNPRYIKIMDMHNMSFADGSFDALYCAGVFHCTKDPKKLAEEFKRVLRPNGLIAISVPVGFELSDVYSYDPQSLTQLHELFTLKRQNILWSETVPGITTGNPNGHTSIHTLFRVEG